MKSILILLLFGFTNITPNDTLISIEGVKNKYSINEDLKFKIINRSNNSISGTIGIEYFYNEKWYEIIYDVERPFEKSAKVYKITKNEVKEISFKLEQLSHLIKNSNKFRVSITYGKASGKMDKNIISQTFEVN